MSIFHCLDCTKRSIQTKGTCIRLITRQVCMFGSCYHLAQPSSCRTTHCELYATACSIYSQLPFILVAVPPSATRVHTMLWWQGPLIMAMWSVAVKPHRVYHNAAKLAAVEPNHFGCTVSVLWGLLWQASQDGKTEILWCWFLDVSCIAQIFNLVLNGYMLSPSLCGHFMSWKTAFVMERRLDGLQNYSDLTVSCLSMEPCMFRA
jgi:hypothetical protein